MVESKAFREEWADEDDARESGRPGGGKGRRDEVGRTGVYPASGPLPPGDAPVQEQGTFGHPEEIARAAQAPPVEKLADDPEDLGPTDLEKR
ncbi:MAG: hypothetical protein HYU41_07060 [Candidatus Rokubacteria bacterium]|nr:hypothetical protein [Candidatus Rokubacteria bacterium]